MKTVRKFLPDMLAVVTFVIIAFVYFLAPVSEGKVLTGVDHSGAIGSGVEMQHYRETHNGERTRWTNTIFGGMPTYQMAPSYESSDLLAKAENVYKLWLPDVVSYVFMMLLGFYIMLRAFNFKSWMAALGAILWAFSSYYFIIIAAGHIWKLLTLCFIPPTIGGMVLCYRGKYLWGTAVTGIFMALQILSNHVQMTYYFMFVIGFMMLAYLIESLTPASPKEKRSFKSWLKASCCFGIGALLGVLVNVSNLFHTWQYTQESMRSKSELTAKTKDAKNQTDSGLERSYITAWSYGGDEMLTLMIPNTKGGASVPLSENSTAMKKADPNLNYMGIYQAFPQYFGEQPGTSGPVYIGAFVMFMFILGLLIVKGPMKWCLLGATLLSILLSLGHNLMWFTDLFLDYVPMYDKFRTVASILVIAEFTMPLLGLLALKQIVENPDCLHEKKTMRSAYIALGLTAGVCLILWMFPGFMGSCLSSSDKMGMDQYVAQGYMDRALADQILASISKMRQAMFTSDCLRSFWVIILGASILLGTVFYMRKSEDKMGTPIPSKVIICIACCTNILIILKTDTSITFQIIQSIIVFVLCICIFFIGKTKVSKKTSIAILGTSLLSVLCLVDMWSVNKRYLNDGMFTTPRTTQQQFPKSGADEAIMQDPDLYYRVFDLTKGISNAFNSNDAACYHKSIGGYHAAKLRRYQELIEAHIAQEGNVAQAAAFKANGDMTQVNGDSLFPVLNMLNMKYMILPTRQDVEQNGQKQQVTVPVPVENPYANGNAWFASEVKYVDNADDELAELGKINTRKTVVANKQYQSLLGEAKTDTTAFAKLTAYEANELGYDVTSKQGGILVFSDIYYPGWTATIDGQETGIARVDYVLRAIQMPAGQHKVVLKFDPQSVHTTDTIAYIALALLVLMLIAAAAISMRKKPVERLKEKV